MSKQIRVKVTEQWRDFDNQESAKNWAKRLLDADVIYMKIDTTPAGENQ